jgi:hypothetical protein
MRWFLLVVGLLGLMALPSDTFAGPLPLPVPVAGSRCRFPLPVPFAGSAPLPVPDTFAG